MATSRYNPYDPYDTERDTDKHNKLSDNERLEKLEKEVCCLRMDLDKMKYEQAITEAAIGRAIIRGSASLGGRLMLPQEQSGQENTKNTMENCPMNTSAPPKSLKSPTGKSRKNEREDGGYFTLG